MRGRFFHATVALVAWLVSGCTVVTGANDYHEVTLEAALDPILPGCAQCLRTSCEDTYQRCAGSDDCTNHAVCRSREPSPVGYWACGGLEAEKLFKELMGCANCADACRRGESLDCTGRYSWPELGAPSVKRRQRFIENVSNSGGAPLERLMLRVCRGQGTRCGPAADGDPLGEPNLAQETDLVSWHYVAEGSGGWAELELPVERGGAGFVGYFVVSGPDIPTYRIHHTEPLPNGDDEAQLFTHRSLLELTSNSSRCSSEDVPAPAFTSVTVLFQVFDCFRQPAVDTSLQLLQQPELAPLYVADPRSVCPLTRGTTFEGNATGAFVGVDPELLHTGVEVRWDDRLFSSGTITLAPGQLSILHATPLASTEITAWPR